MKKISTLVAILCVALVCKTYAQSSTSTSFNPTALKDREKSIIIQDLQLTENQAEKVVIIQMEFMPKFRGIRGLLPEERETKINELNNARLKKLNETLQDTNLTNKVIAYFDEQRRKL
jgi:hypothetical protein